MKIPPLLISTVLFTVFIFGVTQVYAQYGDGFSPVEHYPTINDTKLQLLVMNSTEFKERTLGYNYTFAGINYDWISKGNNNYDFGDARVTFFVFGFGNGTTKGEVFNVNPQMKIKSIFEYDADSPPVGYFSTTCYGGCIPSELSELNKKLETAKGIIESMMMGHNTSGIPFNEVGIERNFTLGVGIDSTKATLSEEQYLKKIKEIVGDIPIKITFGQIQALPLILTNNSVHDADIAMPILPPLKQFKSGIAAKDVKCKEGLQFIMKNENGRPACVTPHTFDELITRGWGIIPLAGLPTYHNTSADVTILYNGTTLSDNVVFDVKQGQNMTLMLDVVSNPANVPVTLYTAPHNGFTKTNGIDFKLSDTVVNTPAKVMLYMSVSKDATPNTYGATVKANSTDLGSVTYRFFVTVK